MRKYMKRIVACMLLTSLVWGIMILTDKQTLHKQMIRLHVVAASDSAENQSLKLQVRDAVLDSLRSEMGHVTDVRQAREYLQVNLPKIEKLANQVLIKSGCADTVTVSLQEEEFPVRFYDRFTLPSGIYEALRITIGEGKGHNWWCVVFPDLCVGGTLEEFEKTAQCAGLSDSLTAALTGTGQYEVHFFVLDALGRLENFLHKG